MRTVTKYKRRIAEDIIRLLRSDPDGWIFSAHRATYGDIDIWISNRPYADLTIGDVRIGNSWTRWKIRRLMDGLRLRQWEDTHGATLKRIEEVELLEKMMGKTK